jgi:hypothetical protein
MLAMALMSIWIGAKFCPATATLALAFVFTVVFPTRP